MAALWLQRDALIGATELPKNLVTSGHEEQKTEDQEWDYRNNHIDQSSVGLWILIIVLSNGLHILSEHMRFTYLYLLRVA